MHVRLLGPVDVVHEGVPRAVFGLRRKAILAALALSPGEILSADRLIHIVWDGQATAGSLATLRSHISQLRGNLGDRDAIAARSAGYRFSADESPTDVKAAELLIRQAGVANDPTVAASRLRNVMGLRRGKPLTDLHGLSWFASHAQRLEQLVLDAQRQLIDVELELGRHTEVMADLERLAKQHPHHEHTHRQLMLALYRSGRQSDALAAYERLRRALDEDLAVAPSQPLRELHVAILRQDSSLDPIPSREPAPRIERHEATPATVVVPGQLPLATAGFAGRGRELAQLDARLAEANDTRPPPMLISAISGTAGVGKTALALHWAHRVRHRFPDGQLYVNLRGYDPSRVPMRSADVMREFLGALGVPSERIPPTDNAQAALYRSLLAGKRVLVVLDNAHDAEQVRPLLPATAGCVVLVTSRNRLSSLVATEGAGMLVLGQLTTAEARELLVHRLGAGRVTSEPEAVEGIIDRCAGLPMALVVAAAKAATQPDFSLAGLFAEFAPTTDAAPFGRLPTLDDGDVATDIRSSFFASYRTLNDEAARLFRLLGIHGGPDIGVRAAASLAARPPGALPALLSELVDAGLLTSHAPHRYASHDLLHAYAIEQAHCDEDGRARHDATVRVVDHYLHTAYHAALLLAPGRDPIEVTAPSSGVAPETFTNREAARSWVTREHPLLMRAAQIATQAGLDVHAWQLAWSVQPPVVRIERQRGDPGS